MESSKKTGCRALEDTVLYINDCDFSGSATTMNMCSKCQKDMILLKKEHAKLAAASKKDVVCRCSSSNESELALAGGAVASADLASHILQGKSKEALKKCIACRKHVGLMGFSCKCGDLFCAVHHYSDKHNCPFDYRNAGQNAIAKANPIIVAQKLNKIYQAPIERLYELKQCPSFDKLASSYRVTMKVLCGGGGGGYPRAEIILVNLMNFTFIHPRFEILNSPPCILQDSKVFFEYQ
ncbi:hypothetical protein CQW23_30778 [Capsicum baccatum]|uniref:Zinc finger A20 and AN1 domain-containing stress-associated protein 8 n=1 Tax=Capsicum baccatum TaxID=33114 RepID=A0A2G2V9F0_CAPBA|nr:hypothetical protein CQW23_30778 [Capsicum baccatum]